MRREDVHDALENVEPATAQELADYLNSSSVTVRNHLIRLWRERAIAREKQDSTGLGRPQYEYRTVEEEHGEKPYGRSSQPQV